ncbi:MAG: ATP-binding cassette domain-containing protein, partial [Acidobacteria bacterium]|nr:ATP-binding cassette domain-containing protein [Acidobacteriota bacterium]
TASSVLLGIGGWLVIERQLTLGQLVASELIVTLMVSGFTKFGKQLEVFYDLQAAIDKLGGLTDLPLERSSEEAASLAEGPASLRFREVEIGYGRPLLRVADFEVRPGERLVIRGEHGSGKSTLVDIIYGLRTPQAGSVHIDGADLRDVPLRSLRASTALVRGIEIFPGTVLESIRLGRGEIPIGEVSAALDAVALSEEIAAFPDGLNTQLHPSGRPLSRSQAARLMLARAIVSKPRLLILDDALEFLERDEERRRIVGSLFDAAAPWTLICVTERDDLRSLAGRTAVISGGVIREEVAA